MECSQPLLLLHFQPLSRLLRRQARIIITRTRPHTIPNPLHSTIRDPTFRHRSLPPTSTSTTISTGICACVSRPGHRARIRVPWRTPYGQRTPDRAIAGGYAAPGFLAHGEDEAIHEAHGCHADSLTHAGEIEWVIGVVIVVIHDVLDEWDEPHQNVHKWVDEHESQLAMDTSALAS